VAFGLLCSHSRLHGSNSYRVPWLLDDDDPGPESATNVLRTFVKLKQRLMPYLYAQAVESAKKGWPASLRAMCLEFPDDPTSWFLDRQFMVGESLLVAPVFAENGEVQFYLPEGLWTSFWDDNETVRGPTWRKEKHGFNTIPIYVRQGTVLVLGEGKGIESEGFEYDWVTKGGIVKLYHVTENDEAILVDAKGDIVARLIVDNGGKVDKTLTLHGLWEAKSITTQQNQGEV